ncbi:MAG: MarR family winged helix-turn-helix transcriptional regulator [Beijerinckiaceae bacterium]|nr:MarR family winged helix-turn-helix transcriptional regulator [Beijerinckiaceae bacterium]
MNRKTTEPAKEVPVHTRASQARRTTPGLLGPTNRVGHLLRRAFQAAQEISAHGFADLDLTPRQAAAVWQIHLAGSLSQRELGEAIGMDAPNVHGLVIRLLKRGVITRVRDAADPRRMRLSLTAEGLDIAVALPERARASEAKTLASLTPAECATLVALLERLIEPADVSGTEEPAQPPRLNGSFT